jgi:hypothetical protein
MRVTVNGVAGIDLQADVATAIVSLNATPHYNGRIDIRTETVRPKSYDFTLWMSDKDDVGAAITGSGRKSRYACWHTHRDVLDALLTLRPTATIATGVARYVGRMGFDESFIDTGFDNVGSLAVPMRRRDACRCTLGVYTHGTGVERAITRLVRVRPRG